MSLTVTLPIPPSVNHCYVRRTVGNRRINVLSDKARRWQEEANKTAWVAAQQSGWSCPCGEKVIVELTVYWPDARRRDAHNLHKLIADALEGVAADDDRWMLLRDIDFGYDKAAPRVEVTVRPQEEAVCQTQ